jgi:hypothetical protein
MRFKKSPTFMGKYLSIYIGGGNKIVGDHEILEGEQWSKFVGLGMLVPVPDEAPKAVAVKPHPKPAPVVLPPPKVEPKAEPEQEPPTIIPEAEPKAEEAPDGMTKSPAGKWGSGKRRQRTDK